MAYENHKVFELKPQSCPNVPVKYNPRNTWEDPV
jgi:hypothetical protein